MIYSNMDRGRWDKSNDITFKVIQGQGQGHEPFKVVKMVMFDRFSFLIFWDILNIIDDYCTMDQYLIVYESDFLLSLSFSIYRPLNLAKTTVAQSHRRKRQSSMV